MSHVIEPQGKVSDQIESAYSKIGFTRAHLGVMVMILIGAFFDSVEQNTVGITGPSLRLDWGIGPTEIGLLNTATFTAIALGRILAGVMMDRFGRRTLLGVNLLVFCAGSLICALAPAYSVLLIGRFIVGIGLGGEIATAVIMMSEFFSAKHRGTAVGLVNVAAAGFGNMLAPLFGVVIFAIYPQPDQWRWVFAVLVVPALLVVFFRRALPETPRYLAVNGEVARANTVINRLAQGRLTGPLREEVAYLNPASFVMEEKAPKLPWSTVFRGRYLRTTVALGVAVTMSYGAQISMLTLIPLILTERGFDITTALWYTLIMQTGSLAGALFAAFVSRVLPRRLVLTCAAALGLVAALGFAVFGTTVALALLFGALFNFAVIVVNTTIFLFAPELYPTRIRGLGTSIILAMGSLAGGLFPLVAGAVLAGAGVSGMFTMLAVLFLICGIAVRIPRETVGRPMEEQD